jgi:branched-chain amino acid transport system substrate-binding protein
VRTYEKLMGSDKVDLILPPWGSNANFALAPLANRFGYPMLAPTALSRKLIDMNLPYFFSLLQQPDRMMGALVDMLVANNVKTIGIVYMDDLFGLENFAALNNALKKTSIQVLERKSYPLGVKDLSPVLRDHEGPEPRRLHRHHLSAGHHPCEPAGQGSGLQPEVLLRLGGHRLPALQERDDAGRRRRRAGHGLVERKTSPGAKAYFDAHTKKFGKEPDRWASGHAGRAWRS